MNKTGPACGFAAMEDAGILKGAGEFPDKIFQRRSFATCLGYLLNDLS
jgi:hypothetical protein